MIEKYINKIYEDIKAQERELMAMAIENRLGLKVGFGIKLNNRLLDQLMRGHEVKVRFDSMSKGLVVIDFTLNNSMPAISRIIGGET